jgi:hypothetical protein
MHMKVRSVGVGRVWDCMMYTCVIHIYTSHGVMSHVPVWVARTDTPVCMCERGGWGRGGCGLRSVILSYTLRYVNLAELGHVCQFGFREPMPLCGCVSEEGGDGEGAGVYLQLD